MSISIGSIGEGNMFWEQRDSLHGNQILSQFAGLPKNGGEGGWSARGHPTVAHSCRRLFGYLTIVHLLVYYIN